MPPAGSDDITNTMQRLGMLKYWKGQHQIQISPRLLQEHLHSEAAKNGIMVDRTQLRWVPPSQRQQSSTAAGKAVKK